MKWVIVAVYWLNGAPHAVELAEHLTKSACVVELKTIASATFGHDSVSYLCLPTH